MDQFFTRKTSFGDIVYEFKKELSDADGRVLCGLINQTSQMGTPVFYRGSSEIRLVNPGPIDEGLLSKIDESLGSWFRSLRRFR